jgi:hypothetical protein
MFVDYTSLNKACPKDLFPFPHIDQVVDLTARCELLSFQDTYSGYHQIPLAEADQPTTTFITPSDCFCYVKMSFRLKTRGLHTSGACSFASKSKLGATSRFMLMTS